jgi:hypothetical protein
MIMLKGYKHSEASKQKMSESQKKRIAKKYMDEALKIENELKLKFSMEQFDINYLFKIIDE